MQEHITTISAEMIAASEDGDFNLAQTKKDNLDELVKEASMEYSWWRAKRAKFAYFYTAARLVAIVPISSAAVERVFSQVKFIIESVGESVLEETLETRVMERINKYRSPA